MPLLETVKLVRFAQLCIAHTQTQTDSHIYISVYIYIYSILYRERLERVGGIVMNEPHVISTTNARELRNVNKGDNINDDPNANQQLRGSHKQSETARERCDRRQQVRDRARERVSERERETATQDEINKGQSVKMSDDQTVAAQNDDKGKRAPTK